MEELAGILFVVVAIIMKVIEAKFKKASKNKSSEVVPQEVFPELQELPKLPEQEPVIQTPVAQAPVEVKKVEVKPEPAPTISFEEAQKPMKKAPVKQPRKPILETEEKKTREKIDPKKLIVYSEIMNRKY